MSLNFKYYNFRAIRKCLDRAFDDVELDSFCQDFYYESVYSKISRGMRKDEKITLLMDHGRKLPYFLEELLSLVDEVNPKVFKYFEEKITKKNINKNVLIETILEWKILHHDSQFFILEVDKLLGSFANYRLDPSLELISKAGLTWQENSVPKLTKLNYNFRYAKTIELNRLYDKISQIKPIVQKMMSDIDHEAFLHLHRWFIELKNILWKILEISDRNIKETAQALQPN
jgi:hypothetical protein